MMKKTFLIITLILSLAFCFSAQAKDVGGLIEEDTATDLIIYYSFDKLNGNIVPDMSGNGHDGAIKGDVTLASGKHGSAAKFANGGYIDLDGEHFPVDEVPKDECTICAWVNWELG